MTKRRAMQANVTNWMSSFLDTDGLPSPEEIEVALKNFGFYHDMNEVKRMYAEYENKGLLGYAGGVLEQPDTYWDDINTMRWLKLWVQHVKPLAVMQMQFAKDGDVIDRLKRGESLTGMGHHD